MFPSSPTPPEHQAVNGHLEKPAGKARRQAVRDLEQSWMDRLQLISVVTTFFAATEAQLLSITTPSDPANSSAVLSTANASLGGALIFHSFAAILSFLAGFVLVKFRLKEAKQEEHGTTPSTSRTTDSQDALVMLECVASSQQPPINLLESYHWVCIAFTMVGFVLAALGILSYIWAQQVRSVGIFSSGCMVVCCSASLFVIIFSPRHA